MNLEKYRYIVVEGPIGVGKTSLARRIAAETGAQPLLEQPQENPFLERFYRDSTRYALPTQMFFLFQRMHQLRDLAQTDLFSAPVVSDFLLEKDPIFATLTLYSAPGHTDGIRHLGILSTTLMRKLQPLLSSLRYLPAADGQCRAPQSD